MKIPVPGRGGLLPLLIFSASALAGGGQPVVRPAQDPFLPGQTWKLSSASRLDSSIPASTIFRISRITADHHIITEAVGLAPDKSPVELMVLSDKNMLVLLVNDLSLIERGGHILRKCFFTGLHKDSALLHGLGVFYDLGRSRISSSEFFNDYLKTHPAASAVNAMQAFVQALNPADNGPCTLERFR